MQGCARPQPALAPLVVGSKSGQYPTDAIFRKPKYNENLEAHLMQSNDSSEW